MEKKWESVSHALSPPTTQFKIKKITLIEKMVRVKQFGVVCDKPILANNPKRMPGKKSKKKKKKGKKQKREEWESEEEQAVQVDDAIT